MNLKVTPQELLNASVEFSNHNSKMYSLLNNMIQTVNSMKGSWSGEASTAYVAKFSGLQDDITRLNKLIQEHVTDLADIAQAYMQAEKQNQAQSSGLPTNII